MNALVPEILNKNEVERQSLRRPAPVPFVPPIAELPATRDNDKHAVKVKINDETEERVSVFHGGVPEAYLQYIKICETLIRKKDLRTTYEGYLREEALAKEDMVLHDVNKPDADASAESTDVASTSGRIPKKKASTPIEKWMRTKNMYKKKIDNARKAQNGVLEEVFTTYEYLLGEEVRPLWTELVTKVCFALDRKNEEGEEQSAHRGYSWAALELVRREWLLSVFTDDAAEEQRMYLGFYLKYPFKMSIRAFFARMEQLNSYLPLLPCLKDSKQATKLTARMNVSFSEHELAVIILRCMPKSYEDQYYLTSNFIPTALAPLRAKLEAISRVVEGTKQQKRKGEAFSSDKSGKKKKFQPNNNNMPKKNNETGKKKEFSKKFCQRCEEHGGAQTTHNTKECRKYDEKGKLLDSFGRSQRNGGNNTNKKPREKFDSRSFVQMLSKEIAKNNKKSKKRKRSRRHSGSSASSDDSS